MPEPAATVSAHDDKVDLVLGDIIEYYHPDTGDTTNPYLITTTVWDNISVVIGELKV